MINENAVSLTTNENKTMLSNSSQIFLPTIGCGPEDLSLSEASFTLCSLMNQKD